MSLLCAEFPREQWQGSWSEPKMKLAPILPAIARAFDKVKTLLFGE